MLSVFILTLIQSSFSLTDDPSPNPLPQNQLQLTEYGEYVTFIDEELHIPIISTGKIERFIVYEVPIVYLEPWLPGKFVVQFVV